MPGRATCSWMFAERSAMKAGFALPGDAGLETGAPRRVPQESQMAANSFAAFRFGESVKGGFPRSQNYNEHRNSPKGASATEGVAMPGA